ncbi:MAG: FtsX-like permease family protein [Acidobacteriota bacterium]
MRRGLRTSLLHRATLRHLARHPWQVGATVLGVALAVAVVTGIDLANVSAERAFRLGVDGVAGRATHEIVGGPRGLNEGVYARLRVSGLAAAQRAAPVVDGRVRLLEGGPSEDGGTPGRTLRLLGVDPFAEAAIRDLTRGLGAPTQASNDQPTGGAGEPGAGNDGGALGAFLAESGSVAASADLLAALGVAVGDRLPVLATEGEATLRIVARLEPADPLSRRAAEDLLVTDVSTAQELLARVSRLDRIDLRLDEGEADAVAALFAGDSSIGSATLRARAARAGALDQMTEAFRLNLTALSLLALVVGMFLIYNTLTFSVVQRRPLLGRLRALGVTRREILSQVLFEGLALGGAGSLLGLALGWGLAHGLLGLVTQTINDLYFAVSVRDVALPAASILKALALGVGGSLLATWPPAREATRAPARAVLRRSHLETRSRRAMPRLAVAGAALGGLAALLLVLPTRSIVVAFAAVFVTVLAFACVVPAAVWLGARAAAGPMRRLGALAGAGGLGAMAARGVAATLSRTGVATAALVVAVATTVGIGVMIDSFRATLVRWLDTTLQADVFVTSAAQTARGASPSLDPAVLAAVEARDDVRFVATYRRVEVPATIGDRGENDTQLHALRLDRRAFEGFDLVPGSDREEVWRGLAAGDGVLASEPYAYRHGLAAGDTVELLTDSGPLPFEILAVFYDYASDRGRLLIERALYDRHWDDRRIQSLGIYLAEPDDAGDDAEARADQIAEALRAELRADDLSILPNRALRRLSLDIFDRTFRITAVLRLLAVLVAFLGILSALSALQLERGREIGVLRAAGVTPRQVWALVGGQTGLLGLLAGLLAMPLGVLLAALLVHVINKRSFGWTLAFEVSPGLLLQALALALAAALLGGLAPAHKMASVSPAAALRDE